MPCCCYEVAAMLKLSLRKSCGCKSWFSPFPALAPLLRPVPRARLYRRRTRFLSPWKASTNEKHTAAAAARTPSHFVDCACASFPFSHFFLHLFVGVPFGLSSVPTLSHSDSLCILPVALPSFLRRLCLQCFAHARFVLPLFVSLAASPPFLLGRLSLGFISLHLGLLFLPVLVSLGRGGHCHRRQRRHILLGRCSERRGWVAGSPRVSSSPAVWGFV